MSDAPITLLCFARGNDAQGWEAVCVDFDLAVEAPTFDAARSELGAAIRDYVTAAHDESPENCRRLLARRAPLGTVLIWMLRVIWTAIRHGSLRRNDDTAASFPVACPA